MKKLVTFFIPLLIVLAGCDGEDVSPRPIDRVMKDICNNQDILNRAFAKGGISYSRGRERFKRRIAIKA